MISDKLFKQIMIGIIMILTPLMFAIATRSWQLSVIILLTLLPIGWVILFQKNRL